jgi:hypothetical protein
MNTLTRLLIAGVFVILGATCPAISLAGPKPEPPPDHALTLATCHGRYSAVLDNGWLFQGDDSALRLRRDFINAMMEAFIAEVPDERSFSTALLSQRILARSQTRRLLSAAQFGQDARRKRLALGQLHQTLATCDLLIIEPRFRGL